jgi:hypothetical protein
MLVFSLLSKVDLFPVADKQVIADARRIAGEPDDSSYIPSDPREFAGRIFHTCYMATENSGPETRARAKDLAEAIGRSVFALTETLCAVDLCSVTIPTSTWTLWLQPSGISLLSSRV